MRPGNVVKITRWNGEEVDEWAVVERQTLTDMTAFHGVVVLSVKRSSVVSFGVGRGCTFHISDCQARETLTGADYHEVPDDEVPDEVWAAAAVYALTH